MSDSVDIRIQNVNRQLPKTRIRDRPVGFKRRGRMRGMGNEKTIRAEVM
jgi:hypothetical protein